MPAEPSAKPADPPPAAEAPRKRRVLVADDVVGTVELISRALSRRGYEVAAAEDGAEAIRMVTEFRPDLVILDIMMPKVHGIDVLKAVRDDKSTRGTGFIVSSARSFAVDVKQFMALGVHDFYDKACEVRDLVEKVEAYFRPKGVPAPAQGDDAACATPVSAPATATPIRYSPRIDRTHGYWKLWGTRGSIPISGPRYLRHGGNTSCLELRAGDQIVVIDAGSGIRDLGLQLVSEGVRKIPLLIGHTHWDHIQGFPFFVPAYVPGFELTLHGASGFGKDLESVFRGQLDRDYFPVEMHDMAATLAFTSLVENPLRFGPIAVYWEMMNHPGATVGFRVEMNGLKFGYVTDNEFLKGYLGPPHDLKPDSELLVPYHKIIQFLSGIDLLIMEAQYTPDEYPKKVGWGHSSLSNACLLAKLTGAKRWIVTHHDPMHDDEYLDGKLNLTRKILASLDCDIDVSNAFDGMTGFV